MDHEAARLCMPCMKCVCCCEAALLVFAWSKACDWSNHPKGSQRERPIET